MSALFDRTKRDAPAKCGGCEFSLGMYRPGWLRVCARCRKPLCRECLPDGHETCVKCATNPKEAA